LMLCAKVQKSRPSPEALGEGKRVRAVKAIFRMHSPLLSVFEIFIMDYAPRFFAALRMTPNCHAER
ncbi:MAG: hypothetical protein ACUVTY_04535, partial [Armatimonadota bacterium]